MDTVRKGRSSRFSRCAGGDYLRIMGLDNGVSPAVSGQFPEDADDEADAVTLCGDELEELYEFSSLPGGNVVFEHHVDDSGKGKGFNLTLNVD